MAIENVMYFVLGVLAAGLVALMIVPAVWRRAVRLTKKRIEAATPISMAEFRADKDQLRAEFALQTRRLEMNVEALRRRLADQLRDINRKKTELGGMKTEREQHDAIVKELEDKEAELRRRNLELEKENTDLAQKLRMRDREYAEKVTQLEEARAGRRPAGSEPIAFDGKPLSGEYGADIGQLMTVIDAARSRARLLEEQVSSLTAQLENADKNAQAAEATAHELRNQLAEQADRAIIAPDNLAAAEARIADAETQVSTLLVETAATVHDEATDHDLLLAERLTLEDELEKVQKMVGDAETAVLTDWDTDEDSQAGLRGRLDEIAGAVNRLVRAMEGDEEAVEDGQTLYDRVQQFIKTADAKPETVNATAEEPPVPRDHSVSDRLKALRELQDGG